MYDFSEEEIYRYSRHIILPEVGGVGQRKIKAGRVFIIGAGGLGSPSAYYLAAAGVGKIGLIDDDKVDISNLQRQILHFTPDVGRPKVESAGEKLSALNPELEIVTYSQRLSAENIIDIINEYDIVIDGTDNFQTRYLTNDACVLSGKPFVHGGILRFHGQVMTVLPGEGPCFRCIFPQPPPPDAIPTCSQAGVLGVVAGTIGLLQATEVLKFFLGLGNLLVGRLLFYDALTTKFREIALLRTPGCPVCGENPTITGLA